MDKKTQDIMVHYNSVKSEISERKKDKYFPIREYNNHIKKLLISAFVKKKDFVLDIGVGKGGDLNKYRSRGIELLYGIDIAYKSILEAISRFREGEYIFKAVFKTKDGYGTKIYLPYMFDVISIQFSFHYSFSSEEILDIAIDNIGRHLVPGGYLIMTIVSKETVLSRERKKTNIGGYYKIEGIDLGNKSLYGNSYRFTLGTRIIDCEEYLIDLGILEKKLKIQNINIVEISSLRDFERNQASSKIKEKYMYDSLEEPFQDIADLYAVAIFQKTLI